MKVADSQTKPAAYRMRESPKQRNAHLTIAQIEDMHFYEISIKMELRHMEHQTKIFIKEAKETQELFMKLEKERAESPEPEAPFKSQLFYNTAEGLFCFLKQLHAVKGK